MLENYIGKNVRILVATGSGAGISNGDLSLGTSFNPIITVFGNIKSYDNKFLEIENSRMVYYCGAAETCVGILSGKRVNWTWCFWKWVNIVKS